MTAIEAAARALYAVIYEPESKMPWERAPAQHHHVCQTYAGIVLAAIRQPKAVEIDEALIPEVVAALATKAKYFEHAIEANDGADADTMRAWQEKSDQLWALIRAIGE